MKPATTLLSLALLAAAIASAHAADTLYNVGVLTITPYINTATVTAGAAFTLPGSGSTTYNFTDTYDFTVPSTAVAGTSVAVNLDLGSFSLHISNLKLDLLDASNTWLAGDSVAGPSDVAVSIADTLGAGSYHFLVRGLADGTGTHQGIYTFSAAAVPEASSTAMLLAGLGLVGVMARRRQVL
jgi:PEP-CTERM putative exosortase interaction domain